MINVDVFTGTRQARIRRYQLVRRLPFMTAMALLVGVETWLLFYSILVG